MIREKSNKMIGVRRNPRGKEGERNARSTRVRAANIENWTVETVSLALIKHRRPIDEFTPRENESLLVTRVDGNAIELRGYGICLGHPIISVWNPLGNCLWRRAGPRSTVKCSLIRITVAELSFRYALGCHTLPADRTPFRSKPTNRDLEMPAT